MGGIRVSNMRMNNNYKGQVQNIYNQYTKLFEQSDGSKLHRASDDSAGYSKYLRYQNSVTGNDQYQSNVSTALSWMNNSDTALTKVTNTMSTFNQKVVDAATSTNNESDLKDIAKELLSEVQDIVQNMNIQLGGRFLFSGQSDTTLPFKLSDEKVDRGLTKTLDDTEKNYFNQAATTGSMSQFLVLKGSDNNTYYLDNSTGNVYTKEFVDQGYKDNVSLGITNVQPTDAAGSIGVSAVNIGTYFETNGVINTAGKSWSSTLKDSSGNPVLDSKGNQIDLKFDTISQYIVEYNGDDKYISMVTREGMTVPQSDSVNVTGQDVFGADIFDYQADHRSGTAMLNEMLTIVAKMDEGDKNHWASTDGVTVAHAAVSTVLEAQTKMAARNQAYQATQGMLITQNESITGSISEVASTDIGKLSTMLMQYQTIYSLSLSVGSRILPGSLADYLG